MFLLQGVCMYVYISQILRLAPGVFHSKFKQIGLFYVDYPYNEEQ